LYGSDLAVAVLINSPATLRERRRCGPLLDGERAVCTKAVTHYIDSDTGNPVMRQRGGHGKRSTLLAVSKSVTEDRHRPAIGWARSGRNEQVEKQLLCTLRRHTLRGWNLRNENAGVLPVLACELAESECADGTGEHLQGGEVRIQVGRNQWSNGQGLHVPGESGNGVDRENGLFTIAANIEVNCGSSSGLDLLANALQCGCGSLRSEDACRSDILAGQSRCDLVQSPVIQNALQPLAVVAQLPISAIAGIKIAESGAKLYWLAGSIMHSGGYHQKIARILVKVLVRFGKQS